MHMIDVILLGLAISSGLVIALKWKVAALWLASVVALMLGIAVGIFNDASLLAIGAWCVALVAVLQMSYLVGLWIRSARYDQ